MSSGSVLSWGVLFDFASLVEDLVGVVLSPLSLFIRGRRGVGGDGILATLMFRSNVALDGSFVANIVVMIESEIDRRTDTLEMPEQRLISMVEWYVVSCVMPASLRGNRNIIGQAVLAIFTVYLPPSQPRSIFLFPPSPCPPLEASSTHASDYPVQVDASSPDMPSISP